MKILLYTEGLKAISKSGLGKAIKHQMKALEDNHIEYTTNLKDDYDILHVNFYGPKSYLYTKKARKKGKKVVYHAHSTEEDFRNSFLFSNLVSRLFKKWLITCYSLGDYIITPTEYSKRLLENYHMNRPIKAISNGVDTQFFERNVKAGEEFRKTYGYEKKDKVIVGIGLYIERKGILDFVELAKRLPQYQFIWFGSSPLWASPRKIRKAVKTKLPNLRFAGYVEPSMIKSALSGADLYLFPTLEETEGIPIIEALTSKIPTLIRDIPVFEEYPADEVVYKAKNVDEFEEKIPAILEGKLPNLTKKGYEMAKRKDAKKVGKELIETYEEVLALPKREEKKKTHRVLISIAILVIIIFVAVLIAFLKKPESLTKYSHDIEAFNRNIHIDYYAKSDKQDQEVLAEITRIYEHYDALITEGEEKIEKNHEESDTLTLDSEFYDFLKLNLEWKEKSQGNLDIELGSIYECWKEEKEPSEEELEDLKDSIVSLQLKENHQILNNHPNIDLNIMKMGYATDKVQEYLKEEKIDTYMIQAGSIIAMGDYFEPSSKYALGVVSYLDDEGLEELVSILTTNASVAAINYFDGDYVIDPDTLEPSRYMLTVIVIAPTSTEAEALATTLFNMTILEGQAYMEQVENADAMWIYVNNQNVIKKAITEHFYQYNQRS